MDPQLALILSFIFLIYQLLREKKESQYSSYAIWIPTLYIMIIGTRFVSQWMNISPMLTTPDDYLEGSPIDRLVFISFIAAGTIILISRKIEWRYILKHNKAIILLILYAGISIFWSEYPYVAFKRWIKQIGNIVIVLSILTEINPIEAVKTVLRRYTLIVITLSVVFIKYFPSLGRGYERWTGSSIFIGAGYNKNSLGYICLISGLFLLWSFISKVKKDENRGDKVDILTHIILMIMTIWLLIKANSLTSTICFLTGSMILLMMQTRYFNQNLKSITWICLGTVSIYILLEYTFGISAKIIPRIGRSITLTDRVPLWKDILQLNINPLIGTGIESFWLGERAEILWNNRWWRPTQAHNGYLEMYVNLGIIGLCLLASVIYSAYKSALRSVEAKIDYGKFRIGILISALIYNITEAAFKGQDLMWFMTLLVIINVPKITKTNNDEAESRIWLNSSSGEASSIPYRL